MNRHRIHRHGCFIRAVLLIVMSLAAPRAASAVDITLEEFAGGFNNPIGIDFQEGTGNLITSAHYPTGSPHNFEMVPPGGGTFEPFSNVANLPDELKIATVRNSACLGGFKVDDVFAGNGTPGQILRISADGLTVNNPWVTLPGELANLRGSLFHDHFCVAGGDLIIVTGNEQNGNPANDNIGNVWRVAAKPDGSAGTPVKVATLGEHLEGVVTIPNLVALGPMAGRILAGAEDRIVLSGGAQQKNGPNGKIYAINPNGIDDWFTIGAGTGPTCDATGKPLHCNFPTNNPINPEDLDLIRMDSEFFGVNFSQGRVLKAALSAGTNEKTFADRCGQVLITQEFPSEYPFVPTTFSGLSALRWDAGTGSFVVDDLTTNLDGKIEQWEHVTFTSGSDCPTQLTIAKTPDLAVFQPGQALTFQIVVKNIGTVDALNVVVTDPLPTNGGLTWASAVTPATCSVAANVMTCNLGTIVPGGEVTITVTSNAASAGACKQQDNEATVTATNAAKASDKGTYQCDFEPPISLSGRITGGGSIFRSDGVRVTHGFELRCDATDKRQNLEINWDGGNNFHLTSITKAICLDDPKINPPPPPGTVADTYIGEGIGTCNKLPAKISFILTDAGEPGTKDTAEYHITGGCTLDAGAAFVTKGNHQFHKN